MFNCLTVEIFSRGACPVIFVGKEEKEDPQYEGHKHTLDLDNAKEYGQHEFIEACKDMGIIKDL